MVTVYWTCETYLPFIFRNSISDFSPADMCFYKKIILRIFLRFLILLIFLRNSFLCLQEKWKYSPVKWINFCMNEWMNEAVDWLNHRGFHLWIWKFHCFVCWAKQAKWRLYTSQFRSHFPPILFWGAIPQTFSQDLLLGSYNFSRSVKG